MEYSWVIFALWAMLCSGVGTFVKKLCVNAWRDKDVFIFTSFCLYLPFFTMNMLVQWEQDFQWIVLIGAIVVGILNSTIPIGSMAAFKYVNISFALVSMRLITSFLILMIWVWILWEELSWFNYLWFLMWAVAIFLLSWYKLWWALGLHWKGIIWMVLAIIWNIGTHTGYKYFLPNTNVHDFMFILYVASFICILLYMGYRDQFRKVTMLEMKKCIPYSFCNLILYWVTFLYFIPNLYTFWTLSLGYKMLSYSLIIPIILSIIFLWEPVNRTRIAAFGLTIFSIFLFLI